METITISRPIKTFENIIDALDYLKDAIKFITDDDDEEEIIVYDNTAYLNKKELSLLLLCLIEKIKKKLPFHLNKIAIV